MGFELNSFLFFSPSRSLRRRAKKITKLLSSKPIFWIFFLGKKTYQSPILNLNFTPFLTKKKNYKFEVVIQQISEKTNLLVVKANSVSSFIPQVFQQQDFLSSKNDANDGTFWRKRFKRRMFCAWSCISWYLKKQKTIQSSKSKNRKLLKFRPQKQKTIQVQTSKLFFIFFSVLFFLIFLIRFCNLPNSSVT